jgi:hypothetical protein
MQDFDSIEFARAVMKSEAGTELQLMGQRLQLEYSVAPQPAHAAGSSNQAASVLDWICSMCQAVNFSRCADLHRPDVQCNAHINAHIGTSLAPWLH